MAKTLKELRDNIASTVLEPGQDDLIDGFINVTLAEIHCFHPWTWLRQKTTFSTVASQETYNLDEEVDRIAFLRERTTRRKYLYAPDALFYKLIPNPEDVGGSPSWLYRLWEETGFSTQTTQAEKLTVVSSSTADTTQTVVIVGRESTNNLQVSEVITLTGTSSVASANTYAIGGLLRISKSAQTSGTITIAGQTSATTFSRISPEERAPRFKRIGLYPIPSSVLTIYLEYYERLRLLVNDADVPQMDHKWIWVLREGTLAKMWGYKQNEAAAAQSLILYQRGLKSMQQQDEQNLDFIPVLEARQTGFSTIIRQSDSVNDAFPGYALQY